VKPILLRMAGRDEARVVKPVFLRDGKPIPVWELVKLTGKIGVAKSSSRSEAAKKAWMTRRARANADLA